MGGRWWRRWERRDDGNFSRRGGEGVGRRWEKWERWEWDDGEWEEREREWMMSFRSSHGGTLGE